jgi:DNA-binding YbaB/EbfC family protein
MKNLGQMMKQAQQMQAKMAEMQAQLDQVEMIGAAGGGLVQVTLTGKGDLRKIKIDKSLLDPNEVEVLEDLVLAAFSDAKQRVESHVAEEMSKLTGGLSLPPGMKLPF